MVGHTEVSKSPIGLDCAVKQAKALLLVGPNESQKRPDNSLRIMQGIFVIHPKHWIIFGRPNSRLRRVGLKHHVFEPQKVIPTNKAPRFIQFAKILQRPDLAQIRGLKPHNPNSAPARDARDKPDP